MFAQIKIYLNDNDKNVIEWFAESSIFPSTENDETHWKWFLKSKGIRFINVENLAAADSKSIWKTTFETWDSVIDPVKSFSQLLPNSKVQLHLITNKKLCYFLFANGCSESFWTIDRGCLRNLETLRNMLKQNIEIDYWFDQIKICNTTQNAMFTDSFSDIPQLWEWMWNSGSYPYGDEKNRSDLSGKSIRYDVRDTANGKFSSLFE